MSFVTEKLFHLCWTNKPRLLLRLFLFLWYLSLSLPNTDLVSGFRFTSVIRISGIPNYGIICERERQNGLCLLYTFISFIVILLLKIFILDPSEYSYSSLYTELDLIILTVLQISGKNCCYYYNYHKYYHNYQCYYCCWPLYLILSFSLSLPHSSLPLFLPPYVQLSIDIHPSVFCVLSPASTALGFLIMTVSLTHSLFQGDFFFSVLIHLLIVSQIWLCNFYQKSLTVYLATIFIYLFFQLELNYHFIRQLFFILNTCLRGIRQKELFH